MNADENELLANFTIAVKDWATLPAIETGVIVNHQDVAEAEIVSWARAEVRRLAIKDR
jgi:hypothetical protein